MDFFEQLHLFGEINEVLTENWVRQYNNLDNVTRMIYYAASFNELSKKMDEAHLDENTRQYALHRWYNNKTSEICEAIFVEYGARRATREDNLANHIDLYINNFPFDVKVSVFPNNQYVQNWNLDLKRRDHKDRLIKWFYRNQSNGQREDFGNRLFVVCNGEDIQTRNNMKMSFDQMEIKIKAYMEYLTSSHYDFNQVVVKDKEDNEHNVYADIISIVPESVNIKQDIANNECPGCSECLLSPTIAKNSRYKGNTILRCVNCGFYRDF